MKHQGKETLGCIIYNGDNSASFVSNIKRSQVTYRIIACSAGYTIQYDFCQRSYDPKGAHENMHEIRIRIPGGPSQ